MQTEVEKAADRLLAAVAAERVFGWEANQYKNLGEQAEAYKKIRREHLPAVVAYVKELVG